MKFKIMRESAGKDEKRPAKKARMMSFEKWEIRSCTEQQFENRHAAKEGSWKSKGKNHHTIRGGKWIKRQVENEIRWGIEINTPEDLISLIEECDAHLYLSPDTITIEDEYDEYALPKWEEEPPKRLRGTIKINF